MDRLPEANYAFDNGVLTLELTRLIEERGKHWVSEIECSRHINWMGQWRRVDEVSADDRDVELSLASRGLSRVQQTSHWV
jgi:hypothetical protein